MKIRDLYSISRGDKAYLFPESIGDQRRVNGQQKHLPYEDLGIVVLDEKPKQKFVVGTPVYDSSIGKTRYCIYRLGEGEDFLEDPDSYSLDRSSTLQRAKNVEEEIKGKLKKLGPGVNVITDVKELPPYGFEVRVSVAPLSKRSQNRLERLLLKIGVDSTPREN